jgi:hypothetical protein
LPGHFAEQKSPSNRVSKIWRSPIAQTLWQGGINSPFRNAAGKWGLVDSWMVMLRDIASAAFLV